MTLNRSLYECLGVCVALGDRVSSSGGGSVMTVTLSLLFWFMTTEDWGGWCCGRLVIFVVLGCVICEGDEEER